MKIEAKAPTVKHGATPDAFMEHLAMFENSDDPAATTSWGRHVSDEEYDPTLSEQ